MKKIINVCNATCTRIIAVISVLFVTKKNIFISSLLKLSRRQTLKEVKSKFIVQH